MKQKTPISLPVLFLALLNTQAVHASAMDLKEAKGSVLIAAPTALNGPTN